jgi:hypothetical protein
MTRTEIEMPILNQDSLLSSLSIGELSFCFGGDNDCGERGSKGSSPL